MGFSRYLALIAFSLLFLGAAFAVPGIPHQFRGNVTVNGAAADGATIVAKINDVEHGSTTSVDGTYGQSPNVFFVENPSGENLDGKTIEFYLNGTKVASAVFERGAKTELDLSLGTAPYCGDGACGAGEDCGNCPADCGECSTPPSSPPSSSPPSSSPSSGSINKLTVRVAGNCIDQNIVVTVLNTMGNPAADATVALVRGFKQLEEKVTGSDGIVYFIITEAGEYTFVTTKNLYTATYTKIEVGECTDEEVTASDSEQTTNPCESINCDDSNPCTVEYCSLATGHCIYENQPDGTVCSLEGKCEKGVCTEPEPEEMPLGQTGFFGLNAGQGGGLGLLIVALAAGAGYLYALSKRKKKK